MADDGETTGTAMTPTQIAEINRVLDDLTALSLSLKCYGAHPPDTLILPAGRVVEVCATINDAVKAARRVYELDLPTKLSGDAAPANDDAGDLA